MLRKIAILLLLAAGAAGLSAQTDSTLRIDYVLGQSGGVPRVMRHAMSKMPGWGGRRVNLDTALLRGNGQVRVTDCASGNTIYCQPFSTLFQEWLCLPDIGGRDESFEHTVEVPLPAGEADVELVLFDNRGDTLARHLDHYSPNEILVRTVDRPALPMRVLHRATHLSPISVVILAEGYSAEEADSFYSHAQAFVDEVLSYEPFAGYASRWQFTAVCPAAAQSGVSVPLEGKWIDTPFGSHFSTFHMDRYLTSPRVWDIASAADAVPWGHIVVLANTSTYGGGGIFNSYALTAARNEQFRPVSVHEFGHSFGGLGDEYFYDDDDLDQTYPLDVEPWEPNITTLVDFASKWQHLLAEDTPVPTKPYSFNDYPVGVYEGGGYRTKGIYRPAYECRMRNNSYPTFCPACRDMLERMILYCTEPR